MMKFQRHRVLNAQCKLNEKQMSGGSRLCFILLGDLILIAHLHIKTRKESGGGDEVCGATTSHVTAESTTDTKNTNLEMSGRLC